MLGNKCAGQHNLKLVHFKETLSSDNFLAWSSALLVFFLQRSSTPGQRRQASVAIDQALLEGALGQQAACQL